MGMSFSTGIYKYNATETRTQRAEKKRGDERGEKTSLKNKAEVGKRLPLKEYWWFFLLQLLFGNIK